MSVTSINLHFFYFHTNVHRYVHVERYVCMYFFFNKFIVHLKVFILHNLFFLLFLFFQNDTNKSRMLTNLHCIEIKLIKQNLLYFIYSLV